MLSNESAKWYELMSRLAYTLNCFPFYFSRTGGDQICPSGMSSRKRQLWKLTSLTQMAYRAFFFYPIAFWFEFTHDNSTTDRAQFYFILSADSLAFALQICTLSFVDQILTLQTTFHRFANHLAKFHQIYDHRDGSEFYIKALAFIIFGVTCVTPFGGMGAMHFGIHLLRLLPCDNFFLSLPLVCFFTLHLLLDWLYVFFYSAAALMYCTVACHSLRLLKSSQKNNPSNLMDLYRVHMLYHSYSMSQSKHIVGIGLTIPSVIMITTLVTCIGHYNQVQTLVLLAAGAICLITVLIVKACLQLANDLTAASVAFLNSFDRGGESSLTICERKRLRALKILYVDISVIIPISRATFPYLMSEVVVAWVADILIMSR